MSADQASAFGMPIIGPTHPDHLRLNRLQKNTRLPHQPETKGQGAMNKLGPTLNGRGKALRSQIKDTPARLRSRFEEDDPVARGR